MKMTEDYVTYRPRVRKTHGSYQRPNALKSDSRQKAPQEQRTKRTGDHSGDLIKDLPQSSFINRPLEDLYQRFVVFQRDQQGYGLTVSGDNPVFVQSIKEDGPAADAGVQAGDRIIKVNDVDVTHCNHTEVVRRIKAGPYVALTLLGRPPQRPLSVSSAALENIPIMAQPADPLTASAPGAGRPPSTLTLPGTASSASSSVITPAAAMSITSPMPAEPEKQQSFIQNRLNTMNAMREKEMQHIIQLTNEYQRNPSEKVQAELDISIKRIKQMQEQIMILTMRQMNIAPNELAAAKSPVPNTEANDGHSGDGRMSRKGSAIGVAGSRQLSTPDLHHLGGKSATLTEPLRSSSANKSGENMLGARSSATLPPSRLGPASTTSRFRTNSLGERTALTARSVTPPPPPPIPLFGFVSALTNGKRSPSTDASLTASQRPFLQFSMLSRYVPHLSVFVNYLLTDQQDPLPALFFILTDHYLKGSPKDMQRWAYEIASVFLLPTAPLEFDLLKTNQDLVNNVVIALDKIDKDESSSRDIFNALRMKVLEVVKHQLLEFQRKRAVDATAFGPTDTELDQAIFSLEKSKDIMELLVGRHLEKLAEEIPEENSENSPDNRAALACVLASLLRQHGCKLKDKDLLDRWPVIIQKDSKRFKPKDKSKKLSTEGHQLAPFSVTTSTLCAICRRVLWGPAPQGYQCMNCDAAYHRGCAKNIAEACVGKKNKTSGGSSSSFPTMRFPDFRKKSNMSVSAISAASKLQEEKERATSEIIVVDGERPAPDASTVARSDSGIVPGSGAESPSTTINRSESLKAHRRSHHHDKLANRKKSDPTQLERGDDAGRVTEGRTSGVSESSASMSSSHSLHSAVGSLSSDTLGSSASVGEADSDFDADLDSIPSWQSHVSDPAIIDKLTDRVRKRQDIIAELFHTERTHVRNLKVLFNVFYGPMLRERLLPPELQQQVFANLEEMIDLHSELNKQMRRMRKSTSLIGNVGDLLLARFDGPAGQKFKLAAAAFCRNQGAGLEALKVRVRKDPKLAQFLQEAESNPMCRRLQLKDIIPIGMQRLTKYPLLIENILKYTPNTPDDHEEFDKLTTVLANCKAILDFVNQAAKESANENRLHELQERVDMAPFKKTLIKIGADVKDFDLTQYRLLMEGDLVWRISKQKSIDLRVVLLDQIIVLVTKQDDKLVLRYHSNPNANSIAEKRASALENNRYWSPILPLEGLIVRDVATDPKAFFLFSTTDKGAQMYEMVAGTVNDQKNWKNNILSAVDRIAKFYAAIPQALPATATASVAGETMVSERLLDSERPLVRDEEGNALDDDELAEALLREKNQRRKRIMSLASPSAVIVTQTDVMDAEVVLTPYEQMRRRDKQLEVALSEKRHLINSMIGGTGEPKDEVDEFDRDSLESEDGDRTNKEYDAKALVLHAMRRSTHLMEMVTDALTSSNEGLFNQLRSGTSASESLDVNKCNASAQTSIEPPSVNAMQLEPIALGLNRNMSLLMKAIMQQEDEVESLRAELNNARVQLGLTNRDKRCSPPRPTTLPQPILSPHEAPTTGSPTSSNTAAS